MFHKTAAHTQTWGLRSRPFVSVEIPFTIVVSASVSGVGRWLLKHEQSIQYASPNQSYAACETSSSPAHQDV